MKRGFLRRMFVGGEERARWFTEDPRKSAPPPLPTPKDIIGREDTRARVRDASQRPFSGVCLIYAYNKGQKVACIKGTGWLIGPATVLTAAHVVYDPRVLNGRSNGLASFVNLWFAFNDEPEPPFGAMTTSRIFVPRPFLQRQNPNYDIAVISLPDNVGDRFGWFDIKAADDSELDGRDVTVAGYPHDKDHFGIYHSTDKILDVSAARIYHGVDTGQGQSGGPIYARWGSGRPTAFGVHIRGSDDAIWDIGIKANFAVRFRDELLQWMNDVV